MEFLQPADWRGALQARAEHPGATPVWGGTDVMVELNFARSRPDALLDLTRVAALTEWQEADGMLRVGAGYDSADAARARVITRLGLRIAFVGFSDIGSFGGMFACNFAGMKEPVLVSSTDGVGTKLKVAVMMNRHNTVGADLVKGFIAEPRATEGARDVTSYGGWRAYIASLS